jgi:hypothetical protein
MRFLNLVNIIINQKVILIVGIYMRMKIQKMSQRIKEDNLRMYIIKVVYTR